MGIVPCAPEPNQQYVHSLAWVENAAVIKGLHTNTIVVYNDVHQPQPYVFSKPM